jgi:predicted RNase H-like HicB family nuclease
MENLLWDSYFEPSEEGGFTAYVPSLPGCISEGNSREEAKKNRRSKWRL